MQYISTKKSALVTSLWFAVIFAAFFIFGAFNTSALAEEQEQTDESTAVVAESVSESTSVADESTPVVEGGAEDAADELVTEVVEEATIPDAPSEATIAVPPASDEGGAEEGASSDAPLDAPATPELSTDKDDYHPGETATIFGKFFSSIQSYVVKVFGSDDNSQNYTETEETVTTDESGSFSLAYVLDSLYRPFYEVVVSTLGGEKVAETWFRDAAVGAYDQCTNDDGDGYASGDTGCRWGNGAINPQNSTYFEDDATVQRLWLEGFAPGSSHTVTIQYGTTKQGKHAYDFLTTWNHSENWLTLADRCEGITGCVTSPETTFAIPNDANESGQFQSSADPRNFVMRGGTMTAATSPALSGSYAGDSETSITLSFTVPNSGDLCSTKGQVTSCGVVLWFGAHVAESAEWTAFNGTTGAGSINGAPYHVAITELDGGSIGNRDNQMQADAIVPQAPIATLTLLKDVVSDNGGTALDTAWTLTADSVALDISGVEGDPAITAAGVPPGTFTLAETGGPSGYTASTYSCVINDGQPVVSNSVTLADGDVAVCTITNNDNAPALHLRKVVTNDNGGTATVADFTLTANGTGANDISGTSPVDSGAGLDADTFALSETGVSGYSASNWVCVGGTQNGATITLGLGQEATCTITNDDIAPTLTVIKQIEPSNDTGLFNLRIDGATAGSGANVGDNGTTGAVPVNVGAHTVSETAGTNTSLADYTGVITGDCAANGSVSLALGENKTCTITNTKKGHIIVDKVTVPSGATTTFNFTTDAGSNFSLTDAATPHDSGAVIPGTYSVSESVPAGWDQTSAICSDGSNPSSISLQAGETVTCTFTNTKRGTIVVRKNAINDSSQQFTFNNNFGGSHPATFALVDDATPGLPTYTAEVAPGKYVVSEDAVSGWYLDSATCDQGETPADIDVAAGETVTCTFTNKEYASITLVKNTIGGNGVFDFDMSGATLPASAQLTTVGGTDSETFSNINPDNTYTIAETIPAGWDLTSASCSNGDPVNNITPDAGEDITCTFTNEADAFIVVDKVTNPSGDSAEFDFTTSYGSPFTLSDASTPNNSGDLAPAGTYDVIEGAETGWDNTAISCVSSLGDPVDTDGQDLDLDAGETITCTFTNVKRGKIITEKQTLPDGDQQVFDFNGSWDNGGAPDFQLEDGEQNDSGFLVPGSYAVSETVPTGWIQSDLSCTSSLDDEEVAASLDLDPGETITCVFENTKIQDLVVEKTVHTSFTRTYGWTIDKSVTPATWDLFTGDSATSEYTVALTKDVGTDSDYVATGTITITNPNTNATLDATIESVSDVLDDSGAATVDCGVSFPYVLQEGAELVCTYTKSGASPDDTLNTASVETSGNVPGGEDTAVVTYGQPTVLVNDTVNVDDTFADGDKEDIADDLSYTYTRTFSCDADEGEIENTATILETNQSDDASVTVNCHEIQVTKDAHTSYDLTYAWTIEKTGDQAALTLSPGQILPVNYDVTVDADDGTKDNFAAEGTITISNPAPVAATINSVSDVISGVGAATVDCGATVFPYSLAAGDNLVCTYSANLADDTTHLNTATAARQNYDYDKAGGATADGTTDVSGTADISFASASVTTIDECISVTDSLQGVLDAELCVNETLPKTYQYTRDVGPYEATSCGTVQDVDNTATFTTNDSSATGNDTWNVDASVACVCSLTQGYWKTHNDSFKGGAPTDDTWSLLSDALPFGDNDGTDENELEGFFKSGSSWFGVFWTAPKGNAYYNLAHQYEAAKLNTLNGATGPAQVQGALTFAETFFSTYSPSNWPKNQKNALTTNAGILGAFNEGLTNTAGHCTEIPL